MDILDMDHLDVDNMSTRNFCLHAREAARRRGGGEEAAARKRGGGGEEAATQWIGRQRPPWCMLRNTPAQLDHSMHVDCSPRLVWASPDTYTTEKKFVLFDRDLRVWHIISK